MPNSILHLLEYHISTFQSEPTSKDLEAVYLLDNDLSKMNQYGYQAIHVAIMNSFYDTFYWLMTKGVSIESRSYFDLSLFNIAVSMSDRLAMRYIMRLSSDHGSIGANIKKFQWQRFTEIVLGVNDRKLMKMTDDIIEFDKKTVARYLTHKERQAHRIFLKEGLLYKDKNTLFDTKHRVSHLRKNIVAFVINSNNEISVFDHYHDKSIKNYFVHSSMNALNPIFAAGEMQVVDGQLMSVTDYSGHYRPSPENMVRLLDYFVSQHVNINNVKVQFNKQLSDFSEMRCSLLMDHFIAFAYSAPLFLPNMRFLMALREAKYFSQFMISLQNIPSNMRHKFINKLNLHELRKWASDSCFLKAIKSKLSKEDISKLDYFDGSFKNKISALHRNNANENELLAGYANYLVNSGDYDECLDGLKMICADGLSLFDITMMSENPRSVLDLLEYLSDDVFALFVTEEKLPFYFEKLLTLPANITEYFIEMLNEEHQIIFFKLINHNIKKLSDHHWYAFMNASLRHMSHLVFGKYTNQSSDFKDALLRIKTVADWEYLLKYVTVEDVIKVFKDETVIVFMLAHLTSVDAWKIFIKFLSPALFGLLLENVSFDHSYDVILKNPASPIIFAYNPWNIKLREHAEQTDLMIHSKLKVLFDLINIEKDVDKSCTVSAVERLNNYFWSISFNPTSFEKWVAVIKNIQSDLKKIDSESTQIDILQMMIVMLYINCEKNPYRAIFEASKIETGDLIQRNLCLYAASYIASSMTSETTFELKNIIRLVYLRLITIDLYKGSAEAESHLSQQFKLYFPLEDTGFESWEYQVNALKFDLHWGVLMDMLRKQTPKHSYTFIGKQNVCVPWSEALVNTSWTLLDKCTWIKDSAGIVNMNAKDVYYELDNLLDIANELMTIFNSANNSVTRKNAF